MGGLFGGAPSSPAPTRISGIQVQSSAYGGCIPLVYGTNRISDNIFWFGNFQSHAHSGGGGGKGGGGGGTTSYTYTADCMFGLCEGTIQGVGKIWQDKTIVTLSQIGLSLFTGANNQPIWGNLTANFPSQALHYGGVAYVCGTNVTLNSDASMQNYSFEVKGKFIDFDGYGANPANIILDVLTNPYYGAGLSTSQIADLTNYSNYCIANGFLLSPVWDQQKAMKDILSEILLLTNSELVFSEGMIKVVPYGDSAITANGVTYTPNLTPVYDLTDDDYLDLNVPVQIIRSSNADAYNQIQIEYYDRTNSYNRTIAIADDLANIDLYGLRPNQPQQAHSICDSIMAKNLAQIMLQRNLYIRNTYQFDVSWKYILLEPMDLITITDASAGLNKYVVRINQIEEKDDGTLTIIAEDFPFAIATATAYPHQASIATVTDYNATAGNVNTPMIFEPPLLLSNNYEIWLGFSAPSALYAGCDIYVSYDNSSYSFLATSNAPARQGFLTANWTSGNTISVDLTESLGTLLSGTNVLALIDGEVIQYSTATITALNKYTLNVTARGLYGTTQVNHNSGATFSRLDNSVVKQEFTTDMIGKQIYYKAVSYNIYGGGHQALSDVSSFGFVIQGDLYPPQTVQNLSYALDNSGVLLSWSANPEIDIVSYEIRTTDSGWGDNNYKFQGLATSTHIIQTVQNITYYIRAIDSLGNYSLVSASVLASVTLPNAVTDLSSTFNTSSTSMANVIIKWTASSSPFGIDHYEVTYNTTTIKINTTEYQTIANWIGDQNFSVVAVDVFGFKSTASILTVHISIPNAPLNFSTQVINNNVLFYWGAPSIISMPITAYELRKGATWATASVIGKLSGGFGTLFESQAGNYTYWLASIDAGNNYSNPASVATTVSAPPDFVLKANNTSTFSGTLSNSMIDSDGSLLMLVDTSKTWTTHFTSQSWSSPQDQITAGYLDYIQPTLLTASYTETVDLGTIIASSRVTINYAGVVVAGSVSTVCNISLSLDGTNWTTYNGTNQVFGTNFRYYKFNIVSNTTDATGIYRIKSINSTIDSQLKNDGGTVSAVSTDANGTIFNFNIPFLDVSSITCTPQGTTPLTAVFNFQDNSIIGTYSITSNVATINATAHGLIAGQNVELTFVGGTGINGVYSIASVINANSYTVNMTAANSSSIVSSYAESATVYLFNSSGTRVSGLVSWSAKGY